MLQVGPVLEAMEDILAALLRSLDGRVYVAVGRGLWDFTSKDIYDYVDSLQEGKENKVCTDCSTLMPEVAYDSPWCFSHSKLAVADALSHRKLCCKACRQT